MSDHILKTIEQAKAELRKHEEAAINVKRLINQLCAFAGMPAMYQDAELQAPGAVPVGIQRNAFFGRPLATCVREYLEMRKNGAALVKEATLEEILSALKEGGYDLEKISSNPDDAKRGVAITLAKNPQFFRLPNNDWGLLAWYPNAAKRTKAKNGVATQADADNQPPIDDAIAEPVGSGTDEQPETESKE